MSILPRVAKTHLFLKRPWAARTEMPALHERLFVHHIRHLRNIPAIVPPGYEPQRLLSQPAAQEVKGDQRFVPNVNRVYDLTQ